MSGNLSELEARQAELAEASRLAAESMRKIEQERRELQAQIEEAKRNQPRTLQVLELKNERVRLKLDSFHAPAVEILRNIPGRWWDSDKEENVIPIQQWPYALSHLQGLENFQIEYSNGTQEAIEAWILQPHYIVEWSEEHDSFSVQVPKGNALVIGQIPGTKHDRGKGIFYVHLIEGEQLKKRLDLELLNYQRDTEWSDQAKSKLEEELTKRTKLDEIALLQDAEIQVDLGEGNALRGFQKVGVKFADIAGGNLIIADQMGLGKTWQAVAYAKLHNFKVLVICKASLKVNWAREIIRLTGESPLILSGSSPTKYDIKEMLLNPTPRKWTIINYDIFGSKVEYAEETKLEDGTVAKSQVQDRFPWAELLSLAKFDLVILDESHYVKNPDSNRSRASRVIEAPRFMCLTGTPVLNRPGELWAMLTLVAPGKFPSYDGFLNAYTYDGKHARNVEELRSILKSLMIRRLKKDVMKELPAKNRIYHFHELSPKARKLYEKVLGGVYEVLAEWNPLSAGAQQDITSILAQIMRLKQISAIDKMDHTADLAVELNDSSEEKNGHGKVLIFGQFKPVVKGIAKRLGNEALCITGDVPMEERMALVDRFQSDPEIRFLTATWQTAGEGLNLQAAGYVIFNDLFWTPASHEQCEDRAYGRLSDPHPIDAYYIIAEKTIEEWIQELLRVKMEVIQQTVEGMEVDRTASIAKDLLLRMKEELRNR